MITNFVISKLFLLLSIASLSVAEDLNDDSDNLLEVDPILGQLSKDSVSINANFSNGLIDSLGFWLSEFDTGDCIYDLRTS